MTHIEAWLSGSYTTEELHSELTDSEYLRYIRDSYWEDLFWRYDLFRDEEPEPVKLPWRAAPEVCILSTVEGCTLEWDHGGFNGHNPRR